MRQQQTKKYTIKSRACTGSAQSSSLISSVSIGLKMISNIDDAIVYNTTGVHAAEVRGGTFRRALCGLANHNTLDQLTNKI